MMVVDGIIMIVIMIIMSKIVCALAVLVYLVTLLTHFFKCAVKEALKIVILGSLFLSYQQQLSKHLTIYSACETKHGVTWSF